MKQLIAIIFLFAGAFCYRVKTQISDDANISPYIFEDLINSTIEGLRQDLPDPLLIESLEISLPDEEDAIVTGGGSISNLNVTGIKSFQLTALNFQLIGTTVNFTLVLPVLDVYTDFDLNVSIADKLSLYGTGNVTVNLDEVTITASAQANLTGGISVDNLRVQLSLGNASFDLHGLFNDEDVSELLSSILNDLAVKLIDENQELVTQVISPIIETVLNTILGSILNPATTTPPPIDVTIETQ